MPKIEKKFPAEMVNTDDAPNVLSENAAINMRNLRLHANKGGKAGWFSNILQNMKMTGQEGKIPAGSERIADFVDPAGKFVVWFTHKPGYPGDDQINLYDFETGKYWLVARSSLGEYGDIGNGLNFSFGVFYDILVVNGTIYWCDGSFPKKLHIGAGIKACNPNAVEESPFYEGWRYNWLNSGDDDTSTKNLSLAVKPPAYPPMIVKKVDPLVKSNNLTGESFQFALQFGYHSNEESTLSMFSKSSLVNSDEEKSKNVIEVVVSSLEYPFPQGVKTLRLYVKVASTQTVSLVKTWEVSETVPGTLLTYNFYGNYYGLALSKAVASEPFHSVPKIAHTLDIIKNRLVLGRTEEGDDTPKTTSLTLTLGTPIAIEVGQSARKKLQYVMYRGKRKNGLDRPRFYYSGLFIKLDEVPVPGYYLIPGTEIRMGSGFVGVPAVFAPAPTSVELDDLVFKGKTLEEIIEATRSVTIASLYESYINESPSITVQVIGLLPPQAIQAINVFLHRADYVAGIVFYDRYLQKPGVVTRDDIRVSVPVRNFALSTGYNDMRWSVSNANALAEIPEGAEYYAPVIARNSRTLSLITGYSGNTRYGTVDLDGTYKFDDGKKEGDPGNDDTPYLNYTIATVGIGLDTTSLINAGLGYVANPGDICLLIGEDNVTHELPVLRSDGKYIVVAAKDLGNLTGKKFIYEIFTPYKVQGEDFYYETGQLYPVEGARTQDRKYSTLEGSFLPDTFILPRKNGIESSYLAYAMSPNDLFWKRWDTHFGRPNVITELGRRKKPGNISFGDQFIPGTLINGLSAFHALDEENLPVEMGELIKLITTNKVQGQGNVLLAICRTRTASIYIGETEIADQAGNVTLVKSDRVIGQVNVLDGNYGTRHPESVKEYNGQVFFYSHESTSFVRYATNGLFPISDYKWRRATQALTNKIDALELAGKVVKINGGIDPTFKEYLVQAKIYESSVAGSCPRPLNLVVTIDEEIPGRVTVTWDHDPEHLHFSYNILNGTRLIWLTNQSYISTGSPASVVIDGLSIGEGYTFIVWTKCGGESVSPVSEATIYIPGADDPPSEGDTCVQVSLPNVPANLPPAKLGQFYTFQIEVDGTDPISISNISKPSWLTKLIYHNKKVFMSGYPLVEHAGQTTEVQFTLTNCGGAPVNFSKPLTVNLP